MTFENYQYTRPNTEQLKEQLETLREKLNTSNSAEEVVEIFNDFIAKYF